MENLSVVQQRNRELAQRINDEARANPQSPYAGKFVGLANGQAVVVADSLEAVVERLVQVEPDPQRTFCIEAGLDYEAVQSIWWALWVSTTLSAVSGLLACPRISTASQRFVSSIASPTATSAIEGSSVLRVRSASARGALMDLA